MTDAWPMFNESFLQRVSKALESCRTDIRSMRPWAEAAADRLAQGGRLWVAGDPSMVSELSGRAGGIMMIRSLQDKQPGKEDVVLFFPEKDRPTWACESLVVTFGTGLTRPDDAFFSNHSEESRISPSLANAIPGWIFTGELVAALTRTQKMPVIYESIGAYGGVPRITQYKNGEIAFHDSVSVPPVPAGVMGDRFVDALKAMLSRIEREKRQDLDAAGAWAQEARKEGHAPFMYSMGHLFPFEIENTDIGSFFKSGVWNAGFRSHPKPEDAYASGDLAIHIGYQHPPVDLLRKARPAGTRVVYVALYQDRDFATDPGVIWIDPMWPWSDACVEIQGYDVPLLAASGIVNGAIAWEIYRLSQVNAPSR